jgi:Na+/citrate or Na+/malate symporter
MYRLFGLLIISLSLLTASIVWQVSMVLGQEVHTYSVWLIVIVLILGILMLIPKSKNNEEAYVSDEEIEAELLNTNRKNK